MLTVGDIFAGVGGFSLGLERAGMQTRLLGRGDAGAGWRDGPPVPAIRRVDDGLPSWLVRGQLAAYGNAVVPAIVEIFGRAIVEHARLRSAA